MAANSSCWKRLLNWIRNSETKYILFGVIGGIYFSPLYEPWAKSCWLWLNVAFGSVYCLLVSSYFAVCNYADLKTTFYACCVAENVVFSTVFSPLLTYYFRRKLNLVLALNTNEDRKSVERTEHLRAARTDITRISLVSALLYLLVYLGHLIYPLIAANDEYLRDVKFYVIPNALVHKIESPLQFFCLTLFTAFISVLPFGISFLFQMNVLMVAYEFYVAFSVFCYRMAQFSKNSQTAFARINEKYVRRANFKKANTFYAETGAECRKLTWNMKDAIKTHQRLRRALKIMKSCVELQLSVVIIVIITTQSLLISAVYSLDMTSIEKFRGITMEAYVLVFLFCHCYAGRIFTQMGEMIAAQVYDIPWYYLDPGRRKTFYIFLHLAQKPISFYGNKIYSMGMPLFLQIARMGYTYYNFLSHVYDTRNTEPIVK